jgi:hypothetical protein
MLTARVEEIDRLLEELQHVLGSSIFVNLS